VAKLAERFVCVRLQSMNGVNINLFQFDYDLTWMAFFMDAQDRFYARYGGREDSDPDSYLTKDSLRRVMREVVRLHRDRAVQESRYEPAGKTVRTPEEIRSLNARVMRRKPGNRCIHCHDVKQGELEELQLGGKFSKELIFSYPMPSAVGLAMDPDEQNKVRSVRADSAAGRAGVRGGDVLRSADGQRILTVADLARVLELTPREAKLPVELRRGGETVRVSLELTGDWRKTADPAWRSSTYVAGPNAGFWGVPLGEEDKRQLGIPPDQMALRVSHLFPGHPTPVKAGLRLKDVVIEVDGSRQPKTARQLNAHCQMNHTYGDRVPIIVRRGREELKLVLELPVKPARLE
jgi:predicted metalloprotease with PDZ domain